MAFGRAPAEVSDGVLLFRAAGRLCGFPVDDVLEVMRPLAVEPTADTPACVLGVSMVRGRATPVLDASLLLSGTPAAQTGRWIRLRTGPGDRTTKERASCVVLAVEQVIRIRAREDLALAECAPLVRDADAGSIAELGRLDGELLRVLRTGLTVPDGI